MSVNDIVLETEDRPAYVRFETRAVKDAEASMKAGHYVSRDEDWALISALGSTDIVTKKADKWFDIVETNVKRGREPAKHLEMYREIYARWKKGQEAPVDGNSIKNWNALSPAQCENLMAVGLRTIEDVAQAPDDSMRRYGIGIQELKNKAKAWLQAAKDHGPLTEEITKLKTENLQLTSTIEALQDKIDLLSTQVDAQSESQKPFVEKVVEIMEEATPAERYEARFGKKPHHLMKEETILKKLQE